MTSRQAEAPNAHELEAENARLRRLLEEAEETIQAIRSGAVDAFVMQEQEGDRVYTLEGAERPYRVLVECMQEGALVLGLDGTVLFCNESFADLVDVHHERLVGMPLVNFVVDDDRDALVTLLAAGRTGNGGGELTLRRAGGGATPAHFSVSPLPLGEMQALCVVVSDQTQQKQYEELSRAQAALQESEDRFRTVFEQSMAGLAEIDLATGRFVRANPAYCRITGYTAEELTTLSSVDLMAPEDRAADQNRGANLSQDTSRATLGTERRYVRKDGRTVTVDIGLTILRDAAGTPIRGLETLTDVSDRKKVESLLKDADRRKDEFLATLAHELRNPLAPVRSALHILRLKSPPNAEVQWAQDVIDRQVDQMTRLVDDLLDVSRITRNQVSLRTSRIELATVIQAAVETSMPVIDQRGHQLTVALPPDPIMLDADLTRLAQVFSNLLNNSAKYTERGGHIRVKAAEDGGDVVVTVADNGLGISAEMMPRVFDMFMQADRSRDRAPSGLGVGLTLVKRLVEMHGGEVDARSDGPGRGSAFSVRLPRIVDQKAAERIVHGPHDATREAQFRILIVDDNSDSSDSLGMMLRLMGNETSIAYDGSSALERGEVFRPDVVLLDAGAARFDGHDTARLMRTQDWGAKAILIALSGWGHTGDRHAGDDSEFDHYLAKPVDPAALMKLLNRTVSSREARSRRVQPFDIPSTGSSATEGLPPA